MFIKIISQYVQSRDAKLATIWALDENSLKENIVVFVHGGPDGEKNGPHNLFKNLQEMLLKINIESVRFDFMGEGESTGDYVHTTLTTQVEDLKIILNLIYELGYKNITIVAESFGGSCVLGLNPNQFSNLVLLWPAVYFFDERLCFAPFYSEDYKKEIEEKGFIDLGSKKIGKSLLDEIEKVNNLAASFSKIEVPTLIVHGSADTEVPFSNDCYLLYKNMKSNSKVVIFPGLDHFLSVPGSNKEKVKHDSLYCEVSGWIKYHINEKN
jgi:esterase/lipase